MNMSDEPVETQLLVEQRPDVTDIFRECLSVGFSSSDSDGPAAWTVTTTEGTKDGLTTESAICELSEAEWGWIDGWINHVPIRIGLCVERRFVPANVMNISVSTSELYFQDNEHSAENSLNEYMKVVTCLYDYLDVWYGFGSYLSSGVGFDELRPNVESIRDGEIDRLYWLNLYTPDLVDHIGRSNLLSAPAARIEQLSDGGVMLVSTMDPFEFGPLDDSSVEIANHLGLEIPSIS